MSRSSPVGILARDAGGLGETVPFWNEKEGPC